MLLSYPIVVVRVKGAPATPRYPPARGERSPHRVPGPGLPQVVQLLPFRVNAVGTASLDVQVPWKPSEVLAPAAMVAL
jgi:hypothetical protein